MEHYRPRNYSNSDLPPFQPQPLHSPSTSQSTYTPLVPSRPLQPNPTPAQSHQAQGSTTESPHSSFGGPTPGAVSVISGSGSQTHPSPLGPTYLTRYPNTNPRALPPPHSQPQHQHQHPQSVNLASIQQMPSPRTLEGMFGRPSADLPNSNQSQSQGHIAWQNAIHRGEMMKHDEPISSQGWDEGRNSISDRGYSGTQNHGGSERNSISQPAQQPHGTGGAGANGQQAFPPTAPTGKRGSKACVACRKGKNRCETDPSSTDHTCRRCLMNGTPCIFEKASEKGARGRNGSMSVNNDLASVDADGRVTSLERTVQTLAQSQNQIQSTLQQILSMLPQNQGSLPGQSFMTGQNGPAGVPPSSIFQSSVSPPSIFSGPGSSMGNQAAGPDATNPLFTSAFGGSISDRPRSPVNVASGRGRDDSESILRKPIRGDFPELPGFAPPNHRFGTYGIIPVPSAPPSPSRSRHSSRSSSSHSAGSSALPREQLTAPIQALQALANAADQAAAVAKHDTDPTIAIEERVVDDAEAEADADVEHDEGEGERGRSRKRKRVTIDGKTIHLRMKKKKRPDPTPRNPFPDVVTKGLVRETEARELWDIFFSGCHYFVPLWDKVYDQYEEYIERTPFSTNGLLAVAAKIRAGNGPLGQTFHHCLEEAQGIARSTLFGPIVRKEAVMAMLILSVWSQNGWLPVGHALRMGLDMNLHRALDKLANKEVRSESEERDLVVSARIWLNCYMHEHLASLGTGKPVLLRDDSSVLKARDLLSHSMASETDMRLVAGVELVNLRVRILDHLTPLHGRVDAQTIAFVRRMLADLEAWHREWYAIHRTRFDEESVLVKLLETELVYAQLWTVCVALRGCQWDKLPPDQRELALVAKDAASRCLEIFLRSENFRKHLKYATHDQLVSVAFAAVFLLKIAVLFPQTILLPQLISQVSELAHLLSAECFAERYALTLRLMLANFRRKTGAMSTVPGTPRLSATHSQNGGLGQTSTSASAPTSGAGTAGAPFGISNFNGLGGMMLPMTPLNGMNDLDGGMGLQSLLSLPQMPGLDGMQTPLGGQGQNQSQAQGPGMEGVAGAGTGTTGDNLWDLPMLEGFDWPTEFSPSALPVWLQDGNLTDLGLPADGSDSLFLPLELANMFLPSGAQSNALYQYSLPDFGDVGAEAW